MTVIETMAEEIEIPSAEPEPIEETQAVLLDDQFDNHLVKIKVDGEEREVPLSELRNGYMRQADYTVKTQDLANQRDQLKNAIEIEEAFRKNPELATMALAEYYGFTPQGMQQQSGNDGWGDDPGEVDPAMVKIAELERTIKQLLTNQSEQYLDREAQALVDRYPGIDPDVVKRHAIARNLPNLEVAARDLLFDDRDEAWQSLQAKKRAEQEIVEKKREAGVVSPGSGPASGSVGSPAPDTSGKSFGELFLETAKENDFDLSSGIFR